MNITFSTERRFGLTFYKKWSWEYSNTTQSLYTETSQWTEVIFYFRWKINTGLLWFPALYNYTVRLWQFLSCGLKLTWQRSSFKPLLKKDSSVLLKRGSVETLLRINILPAADEFWMTSGWKVVYRQFSRTDELKENKVLLSLYDLK